MIIRDFDARTVVLRKEDPTWKFALGASPVTAGVLLTLQTQDGVVGYGYASATAHMGSIPSTLLAELEHLKSKVVGRDAGDIESILDSLDASLRGAPQAKAAIDCALHDVVSRSLNQPLYRLFGGRYRESVPLLRILAIKAPGEMALQAQKLVDQGYHYLQIKVHGEVDEDVARVRAIRKQVGDNVHLTIDANQAYSAKSAISALNKMADFNIDLAEQPVPAGDFEGLSLVTRSVPITIEADEAAGSLDDIYRLVTTRACDAVSLKIPKLGGMRNTVTAARICEQGGVAYRFGAAVGPRLLASFGMHLACALRGVDYACELAEFARLLDDEFSGLDVVDGRIDLPTGIGSGVVWNGPAPPANQQ